MKNIVIVVTFVLILICIGVLYMFGPFHKDSQTTRTFKQGTDVQIDYGSSDITGVVVEDSGPKDVPHPQISPNNNTVN